MKLFLSSLLLVLIVTPGLHSVTSSKSDKMSYGRYEGTIGSNINITANLIMIGSRVTGNYQYRFIDDNNAMYFGKSIEVEGTIDQTNNIRLREFGRKEFTFKGVLTGKKIEGTWHGPADKTLPFKLEEYYPNGTMQFNVFTSHAGRMLVKDDAGSPKAEIDLTLVFPSDDYINPSVTDSVKKWITKSFFGAGFDVDEPNTMLQKLKNEYLNNYVDQNKDWYSTGSSFDWEKMISMSVVYNSGYMMCLEYIIYGYTGGAHGMTNISYDIIYLDDGRLLTYSDVFGEESTGDLTEVLTAQLRKDYRIPDEVSLKEAGFFVDEVKPNHNIYVNGNGVGFLYNSYAIAPYAQGATHIFLEWKHLKGIVKKGTPVYKMSLREE